MRLFDISKYELPSTNDVDWPKTKYAMGIFLTTYKTNRERMGCRPISQLSQTGHLFPIETFSNNDKKLIYLSDFLYTEECFRHGFSAIMHPFRVEVTERRRKVFYYRFMYGLSIPLVSEKINYQKNVIVDETKTGIIQFSLALNLLELK